MSDSGEDTDSTLDLTSNQFDAYKALYAKNVTLPSPTAPLLDNLTKFVETKEGILIREKRPIKVKGEEEVKIKHEESPSTSRFLPHQEPLPGKPRKKARNVLTRMEDVEGPLSLLQRCMNKRTRLKVVTRNMTGVRGHCSGYLVAFDKHFNLALEDVTEVWTRRKNIKAPAVAGVKVEDAQGEDIPWPQVRVISSTAKTELCERFVSQLLMRGEHVAVVSAVDL